MDTVLKGRILGHSITEIISGGIITYKGIEFEKDDGETIWIKDATMYSRCHYLFDEAMNNDKNLTLWLLGSKTGSWVYGVTLGERYAYESPPKTEIVLGAAIMLFGVLFALFWIGIPIFLLGLCIFIRGNHVRPRYQARDVRAGQVPEPRQGWSLMSLSDQYAKEDAAARAAPGRSPQAVEAKAG